MDFDGMSCHGLSPNAIQTTAVSNNDTMPNTAQVRAESMPEQIKAMHSTPAPVIPTPTPANTMPLNAERCRASNYSSVHADTCTSTHALAMPASSLSASQTVKRSPSSIPNVTTAINTRLPRIAGTTGSRAAVNAPIR